MYETKNLTYIFTILGCIEKCWIYTEDFDNAIDFIFANQQKDLNAVISMFIAIGEESKKIDQSLKDDISTKVNWKNIAGLRDKISHSYRGVDEDVLWSIIKNDLFNLQDAIIEMIKLINPPKEIIDEFFNSNFYQHILHLKTRLLKV